MEVIPPQFAVAVSPKGPYQNSAPASANLDPHGNLVVSQYEAPYRMYQKYKQTFFAANQAATAVTAGVTAGAKTGMILSNPVNSTKNLLLLKYGWSLTVGPAVASVGIAQGWYFTGLVTHTTPLAVYDGQRARVALNGWGIADGGATTPSAGIYRRWVIGAFTTGTLPDPAQPEVDEDGTIEILPGGFIFLAGLVTATGVGFLEWAEIDP